MLRIAGQTAEPIGLNLFVGTHEWPGSVIGNTKSKFIFKNIFYIFFLHGQRRALQLYNYFENFNFWFF